MIHTDPSTSLTFWKHLRLICVGAFVALSLSAINEFPSFPSQMFFTLVTWWFNPLYGGWLWAWLLLEAITALSGLFLLLAPHAQRTPLASRLNLAFGYWGLTWLGLLPFIARLRGETPPFLLWVATTLVIVLCALYVLVRRRVDIHADMFP